jgi:hypothetical protein
MSDIDTPITIEIGEEELDNLRDGERLKVPLETGSSMDDHLEVTWQTSPVESEGAKELHQELVDMFE